VHSDPKLLYRIFQNLVSNAIRYTPSGGGILITNRIRDDQVQISVWDTGVGINEDLFQDIFEEFTQFHNPEINSEDTGLGLGLSISQRTAEMLGHTISVKSELGRGSAFHVFVDRAHEIENTSSPSKKQKTQSFKDFKNANVLCVDNNLQTLDAMSELLTSWKYNVYTCSSINDIDTIISKGFSPDILIVDYQLNDNRTGVEFVATYCQKIDKIIPAIFVTANYADSVKQLINDLGYMLLYKPVKPAILRTTMSNILRYKDRRLKQRK